MRIHPTVAAQSLGDYLSFSRNTQEEPVTGVFHEINQTNIPTKTCFGPLIKYSLKFLCKLPTFLIYSTLCLIGAGYTPGCWKAVNTILQSEDFGYVPKPQGEKNSYVRKYGYSFDNFVQNFSGFDLVLEAIHRANINPYSLDLDKSGYILDTKEEIKELITQLESTNNSSTDEAGKELYTKATDLLKDINTINQLIWGANGPNADLISQNEEPTCQGLSALRGLFLTPELTQVTKGMIKVTKYDLGKKTFIDTAVIINGQEIKTPYSELTRSQSPIAYNASGSTDDSLFTGILSLGIKKASPDRIPNFWPSTSPILLTNSNYSTVGLMAFSDDELDEILSRAPESLITVASKFRLDDIKNGLELRLVNWVNPLHSQQKATRFMDKIQERKNEIQTGRTPKERAPLPPQKPTELAAVSSFPPGSSATARSTTKFVLGPESVSRGHVYIDEGRDKTSGTLTISDTYGVVINLPKNKIRKKIIAIVVENDKLDFFSERTFPTYGLVFGAGLGYFLGKRKIKALILKR